MTNTDYIKLLGVLFRGEASEVMSAWGGLAETERDVFVKRCGAESSAAFVYQRLYMAGVRDGLSELQLQNIQLTARAVKQQMALTRFFKVLDASGIRYAPIKGADLAFRVYPSPALRQFVDWDILFHPADIDRALQLLLEDGWRPTEPFPKEKPVHFHYPTCYRKGIALEAHWTLPRFDGCSPEEIWQYIKPLHGDCGRCLLEPGLNMLLLTRHAAGVFYITTPLTKLLLDAAYLLAAGDFDWSRCREIAMTLRQPYPGDLLAAFPEFFSAEAIAAMSADATRAAAYRQIFETRGSLSERTTEDWELNSDSKFSWQWFKRRLKLCSFAFTRQRHHLSEDCSFHRVLWLTICDTAGKLIRSVRHYLRDDSAMRKYIKAVEIAEGRSVGMSSAECERQGSRCGEKEREQ